MSTVSVFHFEIQKAESAHLFISGQTAIRQIESVDLPQFESRRKT
jgi:hypothetical protein